MAVAAYVPKVNFLSEENKLSKTTILNDSNFDCLLPPARSWGPRRVCFSRTCVRIPLRAKLFSFLVILGQLRWVNSFQIILAKLPDCLASWMDGSWKRLWRSGWVAAYGEMRAAVLGSIPGVLQMFYLLQLLLSFLYRLKYSPWTLGFCFSSPLFIFPFRHNLLSKYWYFFPSTLLLPLESLASCAKLTIGLSL